MKDLITKCYTTNFVFNGLPLFSSEIMTMASTAKCELLSNIYVMCPWIENQEYYREERLRGRDGGEVEANDYIANRLARDARRESYSLPLYTPIR